MFMKLILLIITLSIIETGAFQTSNHWVLTSNNRRIRANRQQHLFTTLTPNENEDNHKPQQRSSVSSTKQRNKEEQFTTEALELIQAVKAKEEGKLHLIIAQVAPSVRVAIPEEFNSEPCSLTTGKLIAALKKIGFDLVFDTNTGADLTICEEGTELLHRIQTKIAHSNMNKSDKEEEDSYDKEKSLLPLFTSCCPGWLQLVQKSNPELIPYISTCKSPHMMYGAMVKAFSKEMFNEEAESIYFCSVMPCVRKRGESDHEVFRNIDTNVRDVDNVITTKDLGMILRSKGIDPFDLKDELFDSPFQYDDGTNEDGIGTGAGQLFGATGGVMEAAVRTVYEIVTGEQMTNIELDEVRGLDGVKEATIIMKPKKDDTGVQHANIEIRVAVASGLGNAKKLIQKLKNKEVEYDFVEVMACPGGCIGGGGQPAKGDLKKRIECIYALDRSLPRRKSHENPIVNKMYKDFLDEEFGSAKAHHLLHVKPVYGEGE